MRQSFQFPIENVTFYIVLLAIDFGMATTTALALQKQPEAYWVTSSTDTRSSQTGLVGTPNYGAPELSNGASKSIYDVKVDIYSFGIVFFEMCHAPFNTDMERYEVLKDMRKPSIKFPDNSIKDRRQVNVSFKYVIILF